MLAAGPFFDLAVQTTPGLTERFGSFLCLWAPPTEAVGVGRRCRG